MKTKFITLIACMLVCMLATFRTLAQQLQYAKPENSAEQMATGKAPANYTYHVFEAPNKMFGYDIFLNGKIIFHQPASIVQPGISVAVHRKKRACRKSSRDGY